MKVLLAILLSSLTLASAVAVEGYVTDSSGAIVGTGSGLCLHTGSWTPQNAVKGCDPVAEVKAAPVTLNSDVLFAFDSAQLTVAGKAALDALVAKLGGHVFIEGHTDRIGTPKYNKTLSIARANAVADYLASKAKVTAVVSGLGATVPSGKTAACKGPVSQQLIDCLAPDRRVVISIIK
jgi:OOP family OmpA-OmpF porin